MNIEVLKHFTTERVLRIMRGANKEYVYRYWPVVLFALQSKNLDYPDMVHMVLGTIAAEAGNFDITVREYVSNYNTSPGGKARGHQFDLYDDRDDLGNKGRPDGFSYRGGGAIQLTGRFNYRNVGNQLGVPLEDHPELISNPIVSALALAQFLKNKEMRIVNAISVNDLRLARRLVNGGSHGLDRFVEMFNRARTV